MSKRYHHITINLHVLTSLGGHLHVLTSLGGHIHVLTPLGGHLHVLTSLGEHIQLCMSHKGQWIMDTEDNV